VLVFVGFGIATAPGIDIEEHSEIDADSDPETDSDAWISRYGLYFQYREELTRGAKRAATSFNVRNLVSGGQAERPKTCDGGRKPLPAPVAIEGGC
jgi:hypothetical protein